MQTVKRPVETVFWRPIEVARRYGVSVKFVYKMIYAKKLVAKKIGTRMVAISCDEAMRFFENA